MSTKNFTTLIGNFTTAVDNSVDVVEHSIKSPMYQHIPHLMSPLRGPTILTSLVVRSEIVVTPPPMPVESSTQVCCTHFFRSKIKQHFLEEKISNFLCIRQQSDKIKKVFLEEKLSNFLFIIDRIKQLQMIIPLCNINTWPQRLL
jgi:hypothetical protein